MRKESACARAGSLMQMDDRLAFRNGRVEDGRAVRAILADTFGAYGIDLPEGYTFADVEDVRQAYLESGGAFLVLTRAARLIGFFGLVPVSGRRIELKRLYLHAAERGKGLGNRLIQQAIQLAGEMGYAAMYLETTSRFKEAVGLYKKHGFVDDPDGQPSPGHDTAMVKEL